MSDPDLFDRLEHGSEADREAVLAELARRAEEDPTNPATWNEYALGLAQVGRHAEAISIFEQLVELVPDDPAYQINLSVSHSQLGNLETARYYVAHLADHGATQEARELGRSQLEALDAFIDREADDQRLKELQLAALRQHVAAGTAGEAEFVALARILIEGSMREPDGAVLREATSVLEEARLRFPDSVEVLEHLALVYLRLDPGASLGGVLAELERLAPDSVVLQAFEEQPGDEEVQAATDARRGRLLQQAQSDDPTLRAAAVDDLASMVAMFPEDASHRSAYAFALIADGRREEAREQAERIAEVADESHALHFNAGQLFWSTGDRELARRHAELSIAYASSDEERADGEELLQRFARGS